MRVTWIIAISFFTLLTLVFLGLFLKLHYTPAEKAIASGQRVEINLKTGEVKQTQEKPAVAEEKKPEPEKKEAAKEEQKPKAEEKPAEKSAEKATEKAADKPAEKAAEKPAEKTAEKAAEKPKAAAVAEGPKGPKIAIVIQGMGLSRNSTEQGLKLLPAAISTSFSPYAANLAEWFKKASDAKHEVYIDLPMEPKDYPQSDPGPNALLVSLDDGKNLKRLEQVLGTAQGYRGLVSAPDEHFTEDRHVSEWLAQALNARTLPYYFVARSANKHFSQYVENGKMPIQGIDLILDEKITREAIDAKLEELEALAKKSGYATALARPYPLTTQRIADWSKELEKRGVHFVPLSQAR